MLPSSRQISWGELSLEDVDNLLVVDFSKLREGTLRISYFGVDPLENLFSVSFLSSSLF